MGNSLRFCAVVLSVFLSSVAAFGQGIVTGQEKTITYTGLTGTLAPPNTPANNFVSPSGTNTFILPLANPTVSIRVYITNDTAIACASTFTVQMFSSTDAQVVSYNNSLANWQVVPLQNTDGTLINIASPNIPASGAAYISSTAIAAPKVVIQIVNQNILNCPSTNIEVTFTITNIAVTSPLVSTSSGNNFAGSLSQVQGVVSNGQNGATVNPIVNGAVANPINGSFLNQGLDNFGANSVTNGAGPYSRGTVPKPSKTGEFALAFAGPASDTSTAFIGANSGWGCIGISSAGGCSNGGAGLKALTLPNVAPNTTLIQTTTNPLNVNVPTIFTILNNTPIIGPTATGNNTGSPVGVGSPAAGSVMMVAFFCNFTSGQSFPCVTSVTSALGINYKQVVATTGNTQIADPGAVLFIGTNNSPGGAETITPILAANNTNGVQYYFIALTGLNPSSLNQPTLPNQADGIGNQVIRLDAQAPNQFTCSVTLSTNTTSTCAAAATTINGVNVRNYITDFQIQTTTAGTGTTITITTGLGGNCGTGTSNLSAISYPNTTIGIQNVFGMRTPLVAPLGQAVCATQAGTTPGTSVVEMHGFLAP